MTSSTVIFFFFFASVVGRAHAGSADCDQSYSCSYNFFQNGVATK